MTTRDLAERIHRNRGDVSRWETGDRAPKPEHVAQVLTAMGIVGKPYDEIMTLAHDIAAPMWLATTLPAQRQQLATYVEMERSSTVVTDVSPTIVPGLLQTKEYAYAIMRGDGLAPDEAINRVDIRMGRRGSITRPDPVRYIAFIGEAAIHAIVGDPSVMAGQLRFLLGMAVRPNIRIRVISFECGWYPGFEGAFTILTPREQKPIAHVELRRTSMFLHEDDDVAAYSQALRVIDRVAMTPQASAQLITDKMETLS